MQTLRLLFSRRWWWVTLLVIVGVGVLVRLGIWQLNRLQERRAANAQLVAQLNAPPLNLNEAGAQDLDLTAMADRRVTVRGEYDLSQQLLLALQNYEGATGGHLLTPLRIDGSERAILIDRGWIPEEALAPTAWDQFDVTGMVTVTGRVRLTETARNAAPPDTPQTEWYRVNVEAIERQMPYELLPVYVLQEPPPEGDDSQPIRVAAEIDLSEGPHLSYAIQWFLFSLMLGAGYVYYVRRHRAGREQDSSAAPAAERHQNDT